MGRFVDGRSFQDSPSFRPEPGIGFSPVLPTPDSSQKPTPAGVLQNGPRPPIGSADHGWLDGPQTAAVLV